MTAAEQIAAITPRVAELQAKCDKYFQHLVSALAQEGYKKVDFAKLAKPQEHFWKTYFQRELLPLLSPQIVDSRHPFPFLNNKDICYIAQLHSKKTADAQEVLEYLTSVMRGKHKEQTLVLCGDGMQEIEDIDVSARDRLKAAELIGKRYGMFKDNVELGGPIPVVISGDEQLVD